MIFLYFFDFHFRFTSFSLRFHFIFTSLLFIWRDFIERDPSSLKFCRRFDEMRYISHNTSFSLQFSLHFHLTFTSFSFISLHVHLLHFTSSSVMHLCAVLLFCNLYDVISWLTTGVCYTRLTTLTSGSFFLGKNTYGYPVISVDPPDCEPNFFVPCSLQPFARTGYMSFSRWASLSLILTTASQASASRF